MVTELTVHEAAKLLEIAPDTIRRWEKKGLIKASRSKYNHRIFQMEELSKAKEKFLGSSSNRDFQILKSEETDYSVVELFSGAGGLALGLENAGLKTTLLVEIDSGCVNSLRANRPTWQIINADIADVDFTEYREKIDIVAGGFPCQSFSYAGNSKGFEDTRGTLFFEFARCVKEIRPQIALGENVRGLLKHDGGKTLETMLGALDEIGYRVDFKLLRAQFFDVPQKRERLIILGVRKDLDYEILFPKERDYFIPLRDVLGDCPKSLGGEYPARKREIMSLVPPGGYWRDLPLEMQKEYMKGSFYLGGGKTGMARRLSMDEPSLTLTCNPAQKQTERCHPEETRPLNIREYARIQTFPDNWEFVGSIASQYKQIGNAVPVNLGYHIGKCLIAMLDGRYEPDTMIRNKQKEIQLNLAISV